MATRKEKLDAVEAAVEERRQARDYLTTRSKAAAEAKKQYDNALATETAAAERLERADRALEKSVKEASNG